MNLKLIEWNESLDYAGEVIKKIEKNVRIKTYTLYNGDKGIIFQILDNRGKFFTEYHTGIAESFSEMKERIDIQMKRIIREC